MYTDLSLTTCNLPLHILFNSYQQKRQSPVWRTFKDNVVFM